MIYDIKRFGVTIASVQPEGTVTRKIMGEELVNITFTLTSIVGFQINDTITVFGNTYVLEKEPNIAKLNSTEFQYQLQFTSVKYELAKVQFFFPDINDNLTLSQFSITGTAELMIDLLVQNANRIQVGWVKGDIDVTDTKTVSFDKDNCLSALAKIAEEFEIEYWVDGNKTINLTERTAVSGLTLEYGKNKGLTNLTRTVFENSNIVTRLYARGSEDNISRDYRGYSKNLLMPEPLEYLEKNVAKYGIIEHIEFFEDIRPERIGTVTAVNAGNPLQFTDEDLDFDLNETDAEGSVILIDSVPAKVSFLTGKLAGYTFEIKEYGYDHDTRTFELLVNEDEKALEIPSELLRPQIGDTYVLLDIIMPPSYVAAAEAKLQVAAQKFIDENSEQQVKYSANPDRLYLRAINADIALGNTINFKDDDFNLDADLRIVALVQDLQDEFNVNFEIAEKAVLSTIVRQYIENQQEAAAVTRSITVNALQARRNYLFSRELRETLFDPDGYFDTENIKPLSIETSMLSVGSKSRQFIINDLLIEANFEGNVDKVRCGNGTLVHFTIDDAGLKTWDLIGNIFDLVLGSGAHYIYAKCPKAGTEGEFLVTQTQYNTEVGTFYYFIIGVVHTAVASVRGISLTYGQTTINGKFITTGKIQSSDGLNFVDLDGNKFHFGNADSYIDWNNLEEDTLKINGAVMLQNLWAEEATIADWKVKDGKITSQNEYLGNPRAQLDGTNGKLILRSPKVIYNTDGTTSEVKQIIEVDSINGRILAKHDGSSNQVPGTSVMDSEGFSVNFAGLDIDDPLTATMKAGFSGNVKGKMSRGGFGALNPLVGVYGRAENLDSDPSEAYGGYFYNLLVNGLIFNSVVSQQSRTITPNDVFITMINTVSRTITLPTYLHGQGVGRILFVRAAGSSVVIDGNGTNIYTDTNVSTVTITDGDLAILFFRGDIWTYNKVKF